MTKLKLAVAVVLLAVTAGCLGGGPTPSDDDLQEDATYDWDTDADVTVVVEGEEYKTVATVEDTGKVRLARSSGFGGRNPLFISAVQFRYPNGTVVGADAIDVSSKDQRTVVELPADNGTLAYTSNAGSRSATIPLDFEGSHEVVLPAAMRVSFPLFGSVDPGGYEKTVEDNRVHLRWDSLSNATIEVDFYLERDLYLFGGIIGVLAVAALAGVAYYRLRIRRLEQEREQAGLDVEK
ncbi:DUF5803 family protein [Halobacterium bonnevillei]|uniref:Lipoprotein n=1 Tax=Halobacterium bonnevillei TaxID=2692200 RepID=A0A6B0SFW3_9EURY|nr:DUF5803 family protein [Halobacterium bonnevillei]MXR20625.1 hypothetical protein [Halobacterium bonnevillei]